MALGIVAVAPAEITIENIEAGTEVRYPVVLLRGKAGGPDIAAGLSWKQMVKFPVVDGQYVALAELRPGKNMVLITSGRDVVKMRLDYLPMTSPYKVASIFLLASDEQPTAPQYRERIDTGLKLLQCFTAEAMNNAGYGRKTFQLDFDDAGKVKIQSETAPKTGNDLRAMDGMALWYYFNGLLEPKMGYDVTKCCAIMGFTKYDPVTKKAGGHTALGGGGLGLFGSGSFFSWPTSLKDVVSCFSDPREVDTTKDLDDSGLRGTYWGSSATTLGAVLHEMGHTFGLPHSYDRYCIMSRGFDYLNRMFTLVEPPRKGGKEPTKFKPDEIARWDPFFAARLNWSPWFQADGNLGKKFLTVNGPTIKIEGETVVFSGLNGLRVVGAETDDHPSTFKENREEFVKEMRLSRKELHEKVGAKKIDLYAVDSWGNEVHLQDMLE